MATAAPGTKQAREPRAVTDPVLSISEIFCSLQGEGARAGRPCVFVRLAGCNLSCPWCDTVYTWKPGHVTAADRTPFTVSALLNRVAAYGVPLVEVTGGEPLLQKGTRPLLTALCDRGCEVLLDTSGSVSTEGVDPRVVVLLDLKCPASGQTDRMDWSNLERLKPGVDEVKFVLADRGDYEWARGVMAERRLPERVRVLLSPVTPLDFDGRLDTWPLPRELARWMLEDRLDATLQLQLHRLLWPAAVRGTEEGA